MRNALLKALVVLAIAPTAAGELLESVTQAAKDNLASAYLENLALGAENQLKDKGLNDEEAEQLAKVAARQWIDCMVDEFEKDDSDTSVAYILFVSEGKELFSSKLMRQTFSAEEYQEHEKRHVTFLWRCQEMVKSEHHIEVPY